MSDSSGISHWALALILVGAALVVGGIMRAGLVRLPQQAAVHEKKVAVSVAAEVSPVNLGNFKNGFASVIDPAHLQVFRNGQTKQIDVTLEEFPEQTAAAQNNSVGSLSLAGVQVEDLTPGLAQQLGLSESTQGVLVTSVNSSSPAAAALQQGDVIQEVNHKTVHNVQEYQQALAAVKNQPVLLLVNRGGTTHYAVIEPQ